MKTVILTAIALSTAGLAIAVPASALKLTSPDHAHGANFAADHMFTRCGGKNAAPALAWSGAPEGTKSFALTFVDTSVLPLSWSHWIVVNIPADVTALPRGGALPASAEGLKSNFGDEVYAGPCPPPGTGVHAYEFTIYALPTVAPAIDGESSARHLVEGLGKLALAKATLKGVAVAADKN
jgi:Raf kinase inhibitor-like YbhB/YbcL family protein